MNMTATEYNPVVDLYDKYVHARFSGEIEEKSYLEALVAVQMEMLKNYAADQEKVKWLLKCLANKNLKPNLEIEYAMQRTQIARTMH